MSAMGWPIQLSVLPFLRDCGSSASVASNRLIKN
jgi:hypothetical protein